MKQYNEWKDAYNEQKSTLSSYGYDNGIDFNPETGFECMDSLPYSVGPVVWVIMSNYYFEQYEEGATEYGVDSEGHWAAVYDGHCSCYGWEATESNITYYDTLDQLLKSDKYASVILDYKDVLLKAYPFLERSFNTTAVFEI